MARIAKKDDAPEDMTPQDNIPDCDAPEMSKTVKYENVAISDANADNRRISQMLAGTTSVSSVADLAAENSKLKQEINLLRMELSKHAV